MVLGQKNSGSGIRFFRKSGKTWILKILKILVLFAIVTKSIITQKRMDFLQFFLRLWSPNMPIAHLFLINVLAAKLLVDIYSVNELLLNCIVIFYSYYKVPCVSFASIPHAIDNVLLPSTKQ